jgi:hypothetical protein
MLKYYLSWSEAKRKAKLRKPLSRLSAFAAGCAVAGLVGIGSYTYQQVEHKREVFEIYHEDARECYEIRKNNALLHKENANLVQLYNHTRR